MSKRNTSTESDPTTRTQESPILQVNNLKKYFDPESGIISTIQNTILRRENTKVRAVDSVDLSLQRNQVQGIIGESGCGKSTLLNVLMRLTAPTEGTILFDTDDVSDYDSADWKDFRRRVQIIFQDPYNAVDPKLRVEETLREPLIIHGLDNHDDRIHDALNQVQLTPPEEYLNQFPRELSGGEKQRVSIARALVLEPDVLLADEPVSMLDVSTQAAVLELLKDLTENLGLSMLYVSHDLSTVSYICNQVNVMYLGRIVESGPTKKILQSPKHPYTQQLIKAIPIPDPYHERDRSDLRGTPSDPMNMPTGCRFKDRCPERMDVCDHRPEFAPLESESEHHVACHLFHEPHQTGNKKSGDGEQSSYPEQFTGGEAE